MLLYLIPALLCFMGNFRVKRLSSHARMCLRGLFISLIFKFPFFEKWMSDIARVNLQLIFSDLHLLMWAWYRRKTPGRKFRIWTWNFQQFPTHCLLFPGENFSNVGRYDVGKCFHLISLSSSIYIKRNICLKIHYQRLIKRKELSPLAAKQIKVLSELIT